MRQIQESIEIACPAEEVSARWERMRGPEDTAEFEQLDGGRTRITVTRVADRDESFAERVVDVAFNQDGAQLLAELQRLRAECEAAATGGTRAVGGQAGGERGRAAGGGSDPGLGDVLAADAASRPDDDLGALNYGAGRGRGSAMPDAQGASQAGGGTGGTDGRNLGPGARGGVSTRPTTREGVPTPPNAGGVAVNPGRGSDLGVTGPGYADEREGMGGGSFGGNREHFVSEGLSNGMRGGHGVDADGAMGQTMAGNDAEQLRRKRRDGEEADEA
jgi:hypothetical protein